MPLGVMLLAGALHAQTFSGTSGPIPDNGISTEFTVVVGGLTHPLQAGHGVERICMTISHPRSSDLDVKLIAPNGMVVDLFSGIGGNGPDLIGTCLQDGAFPLISQGTPPFNGTYRPMGVLGEVNTGTDGNGTWKLRVTDTYPFADAGTVQSWSITFGTAATGPLLANGSDLPLVLLDTYGTEIPNEPKIPAWMKIVHHGPGEMNHMEDIPNIYSGHVGIERRGHFSNILPQKPYNVETRMADGSNLNVPLLDMPAENDWILRANYNDKSLMRDPLAYELFRSMGHYSPRTRITELVLNGAYQGIYTLTERIKRDNRRVAIARLDPHENTGDDLTGGYILKVDYYDVTNSWRSSYSPIDHPGLDVHFVQVYPRPVNISDAQKEYIRDFVHGFETALYSPSFADAAMGYRAWIDTRSFIDYFLVNELARNPDGFKKSRFFHKDKDSNGGSLKAGPVWDFDWAWMNVQECFFGVTDGSGWAHHVNDCSPDINSPGWTLRLLQDPVFVQELRCRYNELRGTLMSPSHLFAFIDSVAAVVEHAQHRHFTRWPIWGLNSGTPETWPLAQSYPEEVQRLKNWIVSRLAWLDENMPGDCLHTASLERPEPMLRIFPNPVSHLVHVEGDRAMAGISLCDAAGRVLLEQAGAGALHRTLDLGTLASGPYFVRVTYLDGGTLVRQVLVQR